MSELTKRIITALIAAPVFLFLTWLGNYYFLVALVIITGIIQLEIIRMVKKQEMKVHTPMALLLGIPVLLFALFPQPAWLLFLVLLLLTLLIETFSRQVNGWKRLMTTIMVAVMVPALFSGLLMLRNFEDDTTGFILTLTLLLMVWTNDIFAYAGGKSMGKHPLAPGISPAKTVEGFVWGFIGSLLAVALCKWLVTGFPLGWGTSAGFAVIAGLFGPAGDLAESKLKRASGIKDSSGLMPGHGGLYDRFDAVLVSAPAAVVYLNAMGYFGLL